MTMSAKQITTMKYGLRMEKRDTIQIPCTTLLRLFLTLELNQLENFRLHFLASLQTAAVADHNRALRDESLSCSRESPHTLCSAHLD
jgi:hypothetical protein